MIDDYGNGTAVIAKLVENNWSSLMQRDLFFASIKQVAMSVHCGRASDFLKLCALCAKLLRPQGLEETKHFRRWLQQEVAKIVLRAEHS